MNIYMCSLLKYIILNQQHYFELSFQKSDKSESDPKESKLNAKPTPKQSSQCHHD